MWRGHFELTFITKEDCFAVYNFTQHQLKTIKLSIVHMYFCFRKVDKLKLLPCRIVMLVNKIKLADLTAEMMDKVLGPEILGVIIGIHANCLITRLLIYSSGSVDTGIK